MLCQQHLKKNYLWKLFLFFFKQPGLMHCLKSEENRKNSIKFKRYSFKKVFKPFVVNDGREQQYLFL